MVKVGQNGRRVRQGLDGIQSILSLALVIIFSAQLKLVDSPLQCSFVLVFCSVSVSDSSTWANAFRCICCCKGIIENVIRLNTTIIVLLSVSSY